MKGKETATLLPRHRLLWAGRQGRHTDEGSEANEALRVHVPGVGRRPLAFIISVNNTYHVLHFHMVCASHVREGGKGRGGGGDQP